MAVNIIKNRQADISCFLIEECTNTQEIVPQKPLELESDKTSISDNQLTGNTETEDVLNYTAGMQSAEIWQLESVRKQEKAYVKI